MISISEPIELVTEHGTLTARLLNDEGRLGVAASYHVPPSGPVDVRLHSSCLFSESLGAIDCDCAWQLEASLGILSAEGGLLIYWYEEGRGAGLPMKFRAIRLQQTLGVDTAEAYDALGLPHDPRTYEATAEVLRALLPERDITLLTNNPHRVQSMKELGISVDGLRPLIVTENPLMVDYLERKAHALGHEIR